MPKNLLPRPTDSELSILRVLWRRGPSTVRQVQEALGDDTGYTTVLKFFQIMTDKGLVTRDDSQHAHIYQAKLAEEETQRQLVVDLLDRAFSGLGQKAGRAGVVSQESFDRGVGGDSEIAGRNGKEVPMTTLLSSLDHPLILALGWTLLHFLWQGTVAALVLPQRVPRWEKALPTPGILQGAPGCSSWRPVRS